MLPSWEEVMIRRMLFGPSSICVSKIVSGGADLNECMGDNRVCGGFAFGERGVDGESNKY